MIFVDGSVVQIKGRPSELMDELAKLSAGMASKFSADLIAGMVVRGLITSEKSVHVLSESVLPEDEKREKLEIEAKATEGAVSLAAQIQQLIKISEGQQDKDPEGEKI